MVSMTKTSLNDAFIKKYPHWHLTEYLPLTWAGEGRGDTRADTGVRAEDEEGRRLIRVRETEARDLWDIDISSILILAFLCL